LVHGSWHGGAVDSAGDSADGVAFEVRRPHSCERKF